MADVTGLSMASAYTLIGDMEETGILTEITGSKRRRLYLFERYVNLFAT